MSKAIVFIAAFFMVGPASAGNITVSSTMTESNSDLFAEEMMVKGISENPEHLSGFGAGDAKVVARNSTVFSQTKESYSGLFTNEMNVKGIN